MDVPVHLGACLELWVDVREEESREDWGDYGLDGLVEDEGEEDFVDVVREGMQICCIGEGFDELEEEG